MWLLQVFTVLCLLFENTKFIENLVTINDMGPSAQQTSPLIQVISEDTSDEPSSTVWSLASLNTLCDLHPVLHSILHAHVSGRFWIEL